MFTLDQLGLSRYDREDTVSVYNRIDELIGDAHKAQWGDGFSRAVEMYGSIDLFAELYCCATDIWRGMDAGMTREEAIARAEECFDKIIYFYIGSRIHIA